MPACRYFQIRPRGKPEPLAGLEQALAALKEPGYVWLDYLDPTREQLTALAEPLGLHPLSIEDCLDEDQVPKLEAFPGHTFILFNAYLGAADGLAIEEVDLFLGEKFLLSVHGRGQGGVRFDAAIQDALRGDNGRLGQGPDFLLHALLDHIVDGKLAVIERLQEQIDTAEELVLRSATEFNPRALLEVRHSLLLLRKSLFHEREILVKLCRRDSPYVSDKAIFHFRDVSDHLTKFFEVIELTREMVTSLMEMYLSILNNHMARVSNRTNRVVRRLTMITTIFMPLTLLAGIGGMSEWTMMTGQENWRWAYPAFLAGMVALGVLSYLLLGRWDGRSTAKPKPPDGDAKKA
ncbi:MAG TPA: magnesium transporter CorA family protein [Myxococcota bacterium]|nr:magnesium transporter CorA family protein [Myxococcota bacterium]HRY97169.1 magnesium transporter CorA family protein [Myxococcota bacterium]HSA20710.1 magnesium transporter CorA family protein [Myxococcota bacterium]